MNFRNNFTLLLVALSFRFTYTNAEFRTKVSSSSDCVDTVVQKYVVGIYQAKEYVCVGSLVTLEYVVTAIECVNIEDRRKLKVIAGSREVRTNFPEAFAAGMDLSIIKVHPAFNQDAGTIELCKTVLQPGMQVQVSEWYSFRKDILSILKTIKEKSTIYRWINGQLQMTPTITISGTGSKTGAPGVVDGALCAVAGSYFRSSCMIYTDLSADSEPLLFIRQRTGCQ